MTLWVGVFATKIRDTLWKERTKSHKLSCNLHMFVMVHARAHTQIQ